MAGQVIKCRAAVIWAPQTPQVIEEVEVDPPENLEVRVKVMYNALCHSDLHMLNRVYPSFLYPMVVGHEATGVVESTGAGVSNVQPGDHVILLYQAQCQQCEVCKRGIKNYCGSLTWPALQNCRITCKGKRVRQFMGLGAFSEYTTMKYYHVLKIRPTVDLAKNCVIACGLATGYGAALNSAKIERGDKVAIFGLGGVGLAAIQGARVAGAKEIYAIDINPDKFDVAKSLGATHFVNPKDCPKAEKFGKWFTSQHGEMDKSIECIGNGQVMKDAVDVVARFWGRAALIGLTQAGSTIPIDCNAFIEGKTIVGSIFGEWKSKDVLTMIDDVESGKLNVDVLITHQFDLDQLQTAVDLLEAGKSLRSVIRVAAA